MMITVMMKNILKKKRVIKADQKVVSLRRRKKTIFTLVGVESRLFHRP